MKYLKMYAPQWDEVFQVALEDSDPALVSMPSHVAADLSSEPFIGVPVRSRYQSEADEQRRAEQGAVA